MSDEGRKLLEEAQGMLYCHLRNSNELNPKCHCAACDLHNRITAHLQSGGWISVEERLPDKESLLLTSSKVCIIGDWYQNDWRTCRSHWEKVNGKLKLVSGFGKGEITHWQPLPPLPEEA